jgi:hypothetical protein
LVEVVTSFTFPIINRNLHVIKELEHLVSRGPSISVITCHQSHATLVEAIEDDGPEAIADNVGITAMVGGSCSVGFDTSMIVNALQHGAHQHSIS